jgi:hypothetical protein
MSQDEFEFNDESELYREWRIYHRKNPRIYQLICKFAKQAIARGFEEYAIATIWERLRWHLQIEIRSDEEFKLPNNHRAYYARLWLKDHPQYPYFFRTCMLRSQASEPPDRWGRYEDDE